MVTLCCKFFTLLQASHFAVLLKFIKRELVFCSYTCLHGMCFIVVELVQRQSLSIILDKCMCTCVKIYNVLYVSNKQDMVCITL